jgi:hypothetical protein
MTATDEVWRSRSKRTKKVRSKSIPKDEKWGRRKTDENLGLVAPIRGLVGLYPGEVPEATQGEAPLQVGLVGV